MKLPLAHYAFSSCNLYRTFPSLNEGFPFQTLVSSRPELLKCNPTDGLSLDDDALALNTPNYPIAYLESQSSLAILKDREIQNNTSLGWTFATWFTPGRKGAGYADPIFTIGDLEKPDLRLDDAEVFSQYPGCLGYDFQIALIKRDVLVSYTEGQECMFARPDIAPIEGPTHVAVAFNSIGSKIYVNGTLAFTGNTKKFDPSLQHWNLTGSSLQLLSARSFDGTFRGSIHQFDVFDAHLNDTEINKLYNEGIDFVQPETVQVAANLDRVVIPQNATEPFAFPLGSLNISASVLNLEIQLLSLPQHGILTLNGSSVNLKHRLPVPIGSSSILLEYQANSSAYFNVPARNAFNESLFEGDFFSFQVVARDFKQNQIASSDVETRNVNVIHVNHQGILVTPQEVSRDVIDPRFATVSGIEYSDPLDMSVDFVRVDLSVLHGELTLFPTYRARADFDSCATRAGAWSCFGDGVGDKEMTFLAMPYEVQFILRSLSYRTDNPSQEDELTIRVSDGAEGMCLTQSEHVHLVDLDGERACIVRNDCFQSQSTIRVPSYTVVDPVVDPDASTRSDGFLGFLHVADLIFWAMVIVLVGCCALSYKQVARCFARGKEVDADSKEDISAEQTNTETETDSAV
jgi:hypothetical protein